MAKSVRFKEAAAKFKEISEDVAKGKLAPVYLLFGEESYFIARLAAQIADVSMSEEEKALNLITLYGTECTASQVRDTAAQYPMLGSRLVVILRDASRLRDLDSLSSYVQHPVSTTVLVICHEGKSVDKRTALYKHASANGVCLETAVPYDSELAQWLDSYIRSKGRKIDQKALMMLLDHIGTDMTKATNEIDKLFVACSSSSITPQDIEDHTGISKNFNIFELQNAIGAGDSARALSIAEHMAERKDFFINLTIGGLFEYFLKLFTLSYMQWEAAKKRTAPPTDQELATKMGVHPFFVKDYRSASRLFPAKRIFPIFGILREYDLRTKGVGAGQVSDGELLRELLLRIMTV